MKINQRRIAEQAGVSCATVSRALSGASVSADIRQRIEEAVLSLGYQSTIHEPAANRLVMVIAGDVSESFFANIIRGICDRLQQTGYYPVLCNSNFQGELEQTYIQTADRSGYAGIIMITAMESPALVELIRTLRVPLVLVNRYIRALNLDEVCVDNFRGAYMATEHLLEKGHRRIAHSAGPDNSTATQDRLRGYQSAMLDAGLQVPDGYVLRGDLSPKSGYQQASALIGSPRRFSAVFVANAQMSFGMLNRFHELGVRVPDDLSVVCHDELPHIIDGPFQLTTVSYDPYPLGVEAVNVLVRRLQQRSVGQIRIFYSPHLTYRDSVKAIESSS